MAVSSTRNPREPGQIMDVIGLPGAGEKVLEFCQANRQFTAELTTVSNALILFAHDGESLLLAGGSAPKPLAQGQKQEL